MQVKHRVLPDKRAAAKTYKLVDKEGIFCGATFI